jgi:hypothetical protein
MRYFPKPKPKTIADEDDHQQAKIAGGQTTEQNLRKGINQRTAIALASSRPLLPPADLRENPIVDPPLVPHKFAMFICKENVRLHTFIQFDAQNQLPDMELTNFRSWENRFPRLQSISDLEANSLQIIFVEAVLELMMWHKPGAELGIEFDLWSTRDLTSHQGGACNTYFYENGTLAERGFVAGRMNCENGWMSVPFGSAYWAQKVTYLGALLRDAAQRRILSDIEDSETAAIARETASVYEERVKEEVSRLTAVQEFYSASANSTTSSKTLMVFWTFAQSSGEHGKTRWANVLTQPSISKLHYSNGVFDFEPNMVRAHPKEVFRQTLKAVPTTMDHMPTVCLKSQFPGAPPTELTENERELGLIYIQHGHDRGEKDILNFPGFVPVVCSEGLEHHMPFAVTHTLDDTNGTTAEEHDAKTSILYRAKDGKPLYTDPMTHGCDNDTIVANMDGLELPGASLRLHEMIGEDGFDAIMAPDSRCWSTRPVMQSRVYQSWDFGHEAYQSHAIQAQVGADGDDSTLSLERIAI